MNNTFSSSNFPKVKNLSPPIIFSASGPDTWTNSSGTSILSTIAEYSFTGKPQIRTLTNGVYKLQCWGAQGGVYSSSASASYGGYSEATLTVVEDVQLYIVVGAAGAGAFTGGAGSDIGYNGGGGSKNYGGSGGGASDIRILQDNVYNRIIVAGGGGGSGYSTLKGGNGGGAYGLSGTTGTYAGGGGGGPTSGGSSYSGPAGVWATASHNTSTGGGGGGGWYGGGGGSSGSQDSGGGGGSGYILTTSSAKPTNYFSLNPKYYLTNGITVSYGNTGYINSPGGSNGYVKITPITVGVNLKYDRAIEYFNVETSGWYILIASGGRGSLAPNSPSNALPGYAAVITSLVWLEKDDKLRIIVGRYGRSQGQNIVGQDCSSGGSGGSSSVWKVINSITDSRYQFTKGGVEYFGEKWECLIYAAGGGGVRDNLPDYNPSFGSYTKGVDAYIGTVVSPNYWLGINTNSGNEMPGPFRILNYDGAPMTYYRQNNNAYSWGGYGGGGCSDDRPTLGNCWYYSGSGDNFSSYLPYSFVNGTLIGTGYPTSAYDDDGQVTIYRVTQ